MAEDRGPCGRGPPIPADTPYAAGSNPDGTGLVPGSPASASFCASSQSGPILDRAARNGVEHLAVRSGKGSLARVVAAALAYTNADIMPAADAR